MFFLRFFSQIVTAEYVDGALFPRLISARRATACPGHLAAATQPGHAPSAFPVRPNRENYEQNPSPCFRHLLQEQRLMAQPKPAETKQNKETAKRALC